MSKLTHINKDGKARMIDVGGKPEQLRIASAKGTIRLSPETIELIRENEMKKGDVIAVSEIAGIQAAKRTGDLIPLCHPLRLTKIQVKGKLLEHGIEISSEVRCVGQTGVEMEALNAVSVGLLNVYDMCKAVDKNMLIENIRLIEKKKFDL
ncbi:MAG: cyclic pyranopterin monophosphate synthase MoaC [Bacteroidia bacterium]|nr:MAG: cyclic pyranopterin monophosphate synthase MoaC [Bacteroidia bacterium]